MSNTMRWFLHGLGVVHVWWLHGPPSSHPYAARLTLSRLQKTSLKQIAFCLLSTTGPASVKCKQTNEKCPPHSVSSTSNLTAKTSAQICFTRVIPSMKREICWNDVSLSRSSLQVDFSFLVACANVAVRSVLGGAGGGQLIRCQQFFSDDEERLGVSQLWQRLVGSVPEAGLGGVEYLHEFPVRHCLVVQNSFQHPVHCTPQRHCRQAALLISQSVDPSINQSIDRSVKRSVINGGCSLLVLYFLASILFCSPIILPLVPTCHV